MDDRAICPDVSDDVDFLGGPYGGMTQTLAARPGAPDELPTFLFWWGPIENREEEVAGRTAEQVAETRPHYQLSGTSSETGRPRYQWCAPRTPAFRD
ncbi:hypothetical protein [Streptomyces subrutilus]|uniref:Uncharacterized protein n=1 Tax=Streptomyces subrutilus TaxID=36818 RepID=A0A1E5NXH4_9ACTN|nr:hypothetical protein [Streptomyces subrutilus]OEJ20936.1 hypothetical protein BGK67_35465 [Streptomyces subrutilus]